MDLKVTILSDSLELFVEIFYDHFFEQTFEIAHIFRNTEIGKQKKEFKLFIQKVIDNSDDLTPIYPQLEELGVRHICYETTQRHYQLAKDSFLHALAKTYGSQWNDDLLSNWTIVLDIINQRMLEGALKFEQAS